MKTASFQTGRLRLILIALLVSIVFLAVGWWALSQSSPDDPGPRGLTRVPQVGEEAARKAESAIVINVRSCTTLVPLLNASLERQGKHVTMTSLGSAVCTANALPGKTRVLAAGFLPVEVEISLPDATGQRSITCDLTWESRTLRTHMSLRAGDPLELFLQPLLHVEVLAQSHGGGALPGASFVCSTRLVDPLAGGPDGESWTVASPAADSAVGLSSCLDSQVPLANESSIAVQLRGMLAAPMEPDAYPAGWPDQIPILEVGERHGQTVRLVLRFSDVRSFAIRITDDATGVALQECRLRLHRGFHDRIRTWYGRNSVTGDFDLLVVDSEASRQGLLEVFSPIHELTSIPLERLEEAPVVNQVKMRQVRDSICFQLVGEPLVLARAAIEVKGMWLLGEETEAHGQAAVRSSWSEELLVFYPDLFGHVCIPLPKLTQAMNINGAGQGIMFIPPSRTMRRSDLEALRGNLTTVSWKLVEGVTKTLTVRRVYEGSVFDTLPDEMQTGLLLLLEQGVRLELASRSEQGLSVPLGINEFPGVSMRGEVVLESRHTVAVSPGSWTLQGRDCLCRYEEPITVTAEDEPNLTIVATCRARHVNVRSDAGAPIASGVLSNAPIEDEVIETLLPPGHSVPRPSAIGWKPVTEHNQVVYAIIEGGHAVTPAGWEGDDVYAFIPEFGFTARLAIQPNGDLVVPTPPVQATLEIPSFVDAVELNIMVEMRPVGMEGSRLRFVRHVADTRTVMLRGLRPGDYELSASWPSEERDENGNLRVTLSVAPLGLVTIPEDSRLWPVEMNDEGR